MIQIFIKHHKPPPSKNLNQYKFIYTPNNVQQHFPSDQTYMQSQQNKLPIFLSHILITMHFPKLAKTWIKYNCSERLLKHDMQSFHAIDLETGNTPKFISSNLEL